MSFTRRRLLKAAAATPTLSLLPGLAGAAAASGTPVGPVGGEVAAPGMLGLSLSWVGDPQQGPVAEVTALVDGVWQAPVAVAADHEHGPPDPAGRLHGPPVLVAGATTFRITPRTAVTDLRRHDIVVGHDPLTTQSGGLSTVEPTPGLSIIKRSNWTSRGRRDTVDCTILSSVSGLGCRSDVGTRHGVVHHTVNSNEYDPEDVPSLLRGIQSFHMDTRGWDDIAYNFVIDGYGRIWHARDGAIDQPIVGGHTLGFNTESVGVAVLGDFSSFTPSQAVVDAIGRLLGWKLGIHGVDPLGRTVVRSSGGDATEPGEMIEIRNLSGHRDLQGTSCPGSRLYSRIDDIRDAAAELVPVFGHVVPTYRPDEVQVTGWSIERFDPTRAVSIDVSVDLGVPTTVVADGPAPTPPDQYRAAAGTSHGFDVAVPITLDTTSIVVRARAADGRTAKLMDLKLFATFIDVEPGKFFAEGVYWMRANGLTLGTQPGLFEPMDEMNRAQMATFLWRFMDSPKGSRPAPFDDLTRPSFYADAVDWLYAAGITEGRTPTRFVPDGRLTRAQMATFLWRLCGGQPGSPVPFVDLEAGAFYVEAVKWLYTVGVTTGKTATLFAPHDTITRGEMAAFLYRLAQNPDAWTAVTPPSVVES